MPEEDLFQFLSRELSSGGVRWLLVGGFAVNYHGISRATGDVDLLMTATAYEQAGPVLQRAGYEEYQRTSAFARLSNKGIYLMGIDVAFVDEATFEKMWRESCQTTISNAPVRVAAIKHLIAMKLHALKHGSAARQRKDLEDIRDLAAAGQLDLHAEEFRQLCSRFADDKIYQMITGD